MYKLLATLALAALAANANLLTVVSHGISPVTLTGRQSIDSLIDQIPSACDSTCESSVPIIRDCGNTDVDGCLKVCEQSAYDAFITCQNCLLREEKDHVYTSAEVRYLRSSKTQIESGCRSQGYSITPKDLEIPGVAGDSTTLSPSTSVRSSNGGGPESSVPATASSGGAPAANTSNAAAALPAQVGGVLGGLVMAVMAL